jgi:hypothetical protein
MARARGKTPEKRPNNKNTKKKSASPNNKDIHSIAQWLIFIIFLSPLILLCFASFYYDWLHLVVEICQRPSFALELTGLISLVSTTIVFFFGGAFFFAPSGVKSQWKIYVKVFHAGQTVVGLMPDLEHELGDGDYTEISSDALEKNCRSILEISHEIRDTHHRLNSIAFLVVAISSFAARTGVALWSWNNNFASANKLADAAKKTAQLEKKLSSCNKKVSLEENRFLETVFAEADVDFNNELDLIEFDTIVNSELRSPNFWFDSSLSLEDCFYNAGGNKLDDPTVNMAEFVEWGKEEGYKKQLESWAARPSSRRRL